MFKFAFVLFAQHFGTPFVVFKSVSQINLNLNWNCPIPLHAKHSSDLNSTNSASYQLISGQRFGPLEGVILQSFSLTDEGLSNRIKDVTPSVLLISCFHSSALLLLLAMTKPGRFNLNISSLLFFLLDSCHLNSDSQAVTRDRQVQVTASHTGCQ